MSRRLLRLLFLCLLAPFIAGSPASAQTSGSLEGTVVDSQTGEALPGANVLVVGTSIGGATDLNGKYALRNVSAGSVSLRATYVGYKTVTAPVQVKAGQVVKHNFKLEAVGIEGETVVVTAQAAGQNEAINKQLASDQIVSIVSSARIQELPDVNAAESVGRLPGVSILRDGGEGNKVVVRGLSPKFTTVSIDGVRMTSTDGDDRSVDLSMISSNQLEGIEVSKAITADQDADAMGGSVNFKSKEAGFGKEGVGIDVLAEGGYNKIRKDLKDYKFVGNFELRLFDQLLGIFAEVNAERRNRGSDEQSASFDSETGQGSTPLSKGGLPDLTTLSLSAVYRDRKRSGGTLNLDYTLPTGSVKLTNFFSVGDTKSQNRSESYNLASDEHTYSTTDTRTKLNILTNTLSLTQDLGLFRLDARLSHSYSKNDLPTSLTFNFVQSDVGFTYAEEASQIESVPYLHSNDLSKTYLSTIGASSSVLEDRDITGAIDLQLDAKLSDDITSVIKFGGKYSHRTRSYDETYYDGTLNLGSGQDVRQKILNAFPWMKSTVADGSSLLPITVFQDQSFHYGTFMDGDFPMGAATDINEMWQVLEIVKGGGSLEAFAQNSFESISYDYSGHENKLAGYVMAEINVGSQIKITPGVRDERFTTCYTAPRGNSSLSGSRYSYVYTDTTVQRVHDRLLPMVHVKYRPTDWCDVRFAYTNTLAYPDFTTITPRINVMTSSVDYNNIELKPAHSVNFDLFFSFYDNSIGLFTVGGFTKTIHDFIFDATKGITNYQNYPGLTSAVNGRYINTYINNPNKSYVRGIELDWQTHFWYLPGVLSGLVMNVNYTHVYSRADYPYTYLKTVYTPTFKKTFVDTVFTSRLINQPDNIVNLSVGYDYAGFSSRVSMQYTSDIFSSYAFYNQLSSQTDDYLRWDLSVKQELPWDGLQVYFNINNINGRRDVELNSGLQEPSSQQHYGMTMEMGLRWKI